MSDSSTQQECTTQTNLVLETPKMVRVILFNDNYTTMEFVIEILQNIFAKTYDEAVQITFDIHKEGKGICGIYPYDIGEMKAQETALAAQKAQFPLKVSTEPI